MLFGVCCVAKLLLHFKHSQLNNKRLPQNSVWFSTSHISIAFLRISLRIYAGYRNLSNLNVTNLPGLWLAGRKLRRESMKLGMR